MQQFLKQIVGKVFLIGLVLSSTGTVLAATSDPQKMTLYAALAHTYQKNPTLEAARAELRGLDETHAQAASGFKPSVNAAANYTSSYANAAGQKTVTDPKTLSLQVVQSLYSGGSTIAGVKQADDKIRAGRAKLKVVEQQVLLDGITAYMNLLRDQEIVVLGINNEKVFENHLRAASERYKLGDLTKTDVSLAEARLAKATADRISSEGNVRKSRAFFEQVVGLSPLDLKKPKLEAVIPSTRKEAVDMADKNNPSVVFAKYSKDAAKSATQAIEGENLPQVKFTGTVSKIYGPATAASAQEDARSVEVNATLPLYAGGSTSSRIRQSRQAENQMRMEEESALRNAHQAAVEAWEDYVTAQAEIKSQKRQIEAAKLALDGVRVEFDFGSRTTLDLLDAEQGYLDAQVARVASETKQMIAAYRLLSAVGDLTAENLKLDVTLYNPVMSFQNFKNEASTSKHSVFRGDFKNMDKQTSSK